MKKGCLKLLRNFLVANLFALWPVLWVGLSWMPDQVKVEARTGVKVSLVVEGETLEGEEYGFWDDGSVWRFFLRRGTEWDDVGIRLDGNDAQGRASIGNIWLQKWLFKYGRSGDSLNIRSAEDGVWAFTDDKRGHIRLASRTVMASLSGLEVLLLGMSCFFAWRCTAVGRQNHFWGLLGIALVLAFLMEMVLPLQAFLTNQSLFPYTPGMLCPVLVIRFAVVGVFGFLSLSLLQWCFGRWTLGIVFAFAVCVYLESGVLSIGLPSLKGGGWFFENRTRALWDAVVWTGVFALLAGLSGVLKNQWGKMSLGLGVLAAASLLDVKREVRADMSHLLIDDFSPIPAVVKSVEYSSTANVLVFVIDSLEREQAHAVMEDAEFGTLLREKFQGFTEYADNVGTGPGSLVAVANLLTGCYPDSVADIVDYYESGFSEKSVLKDYLDEDWNVYLATSGCGHGFTNRRKPMEMGLDANSLLKQPVVEGQAWNLRELTRFRWLPFCLKARFLWLAPRGFPKERGFGREWVLYPVLANAPETDMGKGSFALFHTDGVHIPVDYNRNGARMAHSDNSDMGCVEMGVFVLGQLGQLFDSYRERGLYDNSLIVVCADHGHHDFLENGFDQPEQGLPGYARPFLWVKPVGSQHGFQTSHLASSHAKVAEILRRSSRQNLDEEDIRNILFQEKRLFRYISLLTKERNDWVVEPDGTFHFECASLERDVLVERLPLHVGQRYVLDIDKIEKAKLDIAYDNLFCVRTLGMLPLTHEMHFRFRVADASRRYALHLTVSMEGTASYPDEDGAEMAFRQDVHDASWVAFPRSSHVNVVLGNLVPDKDGWIAIAGRRGEGLNSFVYFQDLTVEIER